MNKRVKETGKRLFRRLNSLSLITFFFLILAGGIVRSTGSGMGCPDWPKCFGKAIPPTKVEQLPKDYKEEFLHMRLEKNQRLASMLNSLGFEELAFKIENDAAIKMEEDFNVFKTWTEYINRLIGALIGLWVLFATIMSFSYSKEKPVIPVLAVATLVLLLFQAWMGSVVVSTNLLPGTISVHMILAIVIGALIISNWVNSRPVSLVTSFEVNKVMILLVITFIFSIIQLLLGVQVREEVDMLIKQDEGNRKLVPSMLGGIFSIHKIFSMFVVAGVAVLFIITRKSLRNFLNNRITFLVFLIGLEIIAGITLSKFGLPKFAQPLHLLLGVSIILFQWYLIAVVTKNNRRNKLQRDSISNR